MAARRALALITGMLVLSLVAPHAGAASDPLDAQWWDGFALPIPDDTITAIARHGGALYVGGGFTAAGTTRARYAARWDGVAWQPLGDGPGFPVAAMASLEPTRGSLTDYLLLTDQQVSPNGTAPYFTSGAHFDGPVHTNGEMRFAYVPTFEAPVSSVSTKAWFYNHGIPIELAADHFSTIDTPRLYWALSRGAARVELPANCFAQQGAALSSSLAGLTSAPTNEQLNLYCLGIVSSSPLPAGVYVPSEDGTRPTGGIYVVDKLDSLLLSTSGSQQVIRLRRAFRLTVITLDPAGSTQVLTKLGSAPPTVTTYFGLPNGVIYVDASIDYLGGPARVGGVAAVALTSWARLHIVSGSNTIVQRDIIVQDHDLGRGVLGLTSSGGSVLVGTSAPKDVRIDAFVAALGPRGAFIVDFYDSGLPRGTLQLRGGVASRLYGPAGTFDPSTSALLTGYARDSRFDRRGVLPPYYPTLPPSGTDALVAVGPRPPGATGAAPTVRLWDSATWTTIGSTDGDVTSAVVRDGRLVVAGTFNTIDGVSATGVARWDGVGWSAVGAGLGSGRASALAALGNQPIAGGAMPDRGNVAAFDGLAWSALGGGLAWPVTALRSIDSTLYAAGGPGVGDGVLRWDGAQWQSTGAGTPVRAIGAWAGHPVATFGNPPRPRTWDGIDWQSAPDSVRFEAHCYRDEDSSLIAGGRGVVSSAPGVLFWRGGPTWTSVQQAWAPSMSGLAGGARAAVDWNGELVVTGEFAAAGGEDHWQLAVGTALWTGRAWCALGSAPVGHCATVVPGAPCVGDSLGVARWDGATWSRLGADLGAVDALASYGADLVAAGAFSPAHGTAPGVMRWDGAQWQPLGGAFAPADQPRALLSMGGDLFVGGTLTSAGGVVVRGIARWDGVAYHDVGGGFDGTVRALALFGSDLVAGGDFSNAGDLPAHGVARWDGVSWSPMGANAVAVNALAEMDGALYAVGTFVRPDSSQIAALARWDGARWVTLGSGFDGEPLALAACGGDLYVVGDFAWANGHASYGIARYLASGVLAAGPPALPRALWLSAPRPNPAHGAFHVAYALPVAGRVRLDLFDVGGRRVATLLDAERPAGEHSMDWSVAQSGGAALRPGLYVMVLEAGGQRVRTRVALLR